VLSGKLSHANNAACKKANTKTDTGREFEMKAKVLVVLLSSTFSLLFPVMASGHVQLDKPNGGEVLVPLSSYVIEWHVVVAHGLIDYDLWYSVSGAGGPWLEIALNLPWDENLAGTVETYAWTVPNVPTDQLYVRVRQDNVNLDYLDESDAASTISELQQAPSAGPLGLLILVFSVAATSVFLLRRRKLIH